MVDALPEQVWRTVTVLGEPGVGKTRFVEEVRRRAEAHGLMCVLGQCHEGDVAPALWPWMQVVRTLPGTVDDRDPLLAPMADGTPVDTGSGSFRLFDAVGRLLDDTATRAGGLVVVLEDVHWADATSLQLLAHLVERQRLAPVLLVVTRRTTEEHGSTQMLSTLAVLARAGTERIRLDGLGREDVGRLLRRLLGDVPDDLVGVIDDATAGNAFFVREYARLLQGLGDVQQVAALPVPDGVRDVIRQRVGRLPKPPPTYCARPRSWAGWSTRRTSRRWPASRSRPATCGRARR